MPPSLALALTILFIAYLFKREFAQSYKPSATLWIPCIYMLILGSRSVTEWLNLGEPIGGMDVAEGSPLDAAVFLGLIIAGVVVLSNRRISWSRVFPNNVWLIIFILYCGISILWSDFPFVAFKRWVKGFGDPIMMLIILTEREPIKAARFMFNACTYILVPLSVLFIKYYPTWGRGYSEWTGQAYYTGVTTNKNLLGFVLLVSGLHLVWRLSARWGEVNTSDKWLDDVGIPFVLIYMVEWLFQMADTKTPLMGSILGTLVFIALGRQGVRRYIGTYLCAGILTFTVLEVSINFTELLITSAGRDSTLTGRTEIWAAVLHMDPRPMLGHGFESFWLGDRLKKLQDMWYFKPTQAHSGYIETYLNLGWVGLLLLTAVVVSCFMRLREMLTSSSKMTEEVLFGRFGMAFLAAFLAYNYTEAAFKSLHYLFIVFLLFTIKHVRIPQSITQSSPAGFSRDAMQNSTVAGTGDRSLYPIALPGCQRKS